MRIASIRPARQLLRADFLARLVVGIGLVLAWAAVARSSNVTTEADLPAMRPQDAQSGTLLLRSNVADGCFVAPLLSTEVEIEISGLIARAKVRQTFSNPFDDWYEGVYVFPLPERSAVDHLRLKIGERVVEGVIRERAQAKQEYDAARQSGQRAALLEQERPNIFTSSVANIGPGENIVVEIEYQETLRYDSGTFSIRFPMVVGPRYVPGTVPVVGQAGTGWSANTDNVADAARITPPVLYPSNGQINPVSIRVVLDAGVALAAVASSYHTIKQRIINDHRRIIELSSGVTPANRDFELHWQPASDAAPRAAWFTERMGDKTYGLLMLLPPNAPASTRRLAREVIFIIDTSGSMNGMSIDQAKQALELAIERLKPEDRFNVIEFNSDARTLFDQAQPATGDNIDDARSWVAKLYATGGTEMASALNLALDGKDETDRIRQIVFLTDGAVGNEEALFGMIRERLGDSRLFTVGIGSAPNGHFMTKAAEVGRGTFTYISKVEEVRERMNELFSKLESPMLKGVKIDWPANIAVESWPARIPDLYAGEPLMVTAELVAAHGGDPAGAMRVSGLSGDAPWSTNVSLDQPPDSQGIGVLWARNKISALMDATRAGAVEDETRSKVVELALAHHLVTKYTSLVAIDRTPARPTDLALKTAAQPTNLPVGWNYEAVFGELPRGATNSRFDLLVGALMMLAAMLLARNAWTARAY